MPNPREAHFFVLYSARHKQCGNYLERADYRVLTKEDLIHWSTALTREGKPNFLTLHCDRCAADVQPTHLRIVEDSDFIPRTLVPEMEIQKFNPADWIVRIK